ncbi:hypothetical protein HAX54_007301 [Datura stramonium]|uniref:Uncharacterized protein n=1 Tax=Datura stramonium TaxID=4076 RepID=A0ABS8TCF7_DATST|nr:hypothetical protein [Datura stramonium]
MSKAFASNTSLPPWNSSEPSMAVPCHPQFYFKPTTRRHLITSISILIAPFFASPKLNDPLSPFALPVSHARGLFQMPPFRLTNRYFLVRAGESEYESLGVINTNPVAKTSVDNGLSEKGKKQTVRSAFDLKEMRACEENCWIWPSITQRAYQAAEIIAAVNGVNRRCSSPPPTHTMPLVVVYESDSLSPNIKPPPIDDGTPNESVSDVFVRVTQLMSILETQYSEDTVIIVSPDSDNLTILQAGLTGLDLRRHRDLSFGPGEVRFVDASSIPAYKQPASTVYKCLNPPSCT